MNHLTREEIAEKLADVFATKSMEELKAPDLRAFEFMISDGEVFLPSSAAARRVLERKRKQDLDESKLAAADEFSTAPPLRLMPLLQNGATFRERRKTFLPAATLADDDDSLTDDSDGGVVAIKEPFLHLRFPGLSAIVGKVLLMGGGAFEAFYEPFLLEV